MSASYSFYVRANTRYPKTLTAEDTTLELPTAAQQCVSVSSYNSKVSFLEVCKLGSLMDDLLLISSILHRSIVSIVSY